MNRHSALFLALILLAAAVFFRYPANAGPVPFDEVNESATGRYQIEAYNGGPGRYGYYILDTQTGEVWTSYGTTGSPKKIVKQPLRQ